MSGGGSTGNSAQSATSQALQNYPVVPNAPGGAAMAAGAGANPQATSPAQGLSQLQQALQKLGAGGGKSPAMGMMGMGNQMMQQAQQSAPHPQLPMARPTGAPAPLQGPQTPQMATGGMGMGGGMTPAMMNMMLARQNGLMG